MRVIFLDVDGVLNSMYDAEQQNNKKVFYDEVEDRPLKLLQELVNTTKAKIVVSSTWRIGCARDKSGVNRYGEEIFQKLEKRLKDYGMEIYDITPVLRGSDKQRGDEIREWLKLHKDVKSFVILDDDSDMREFTSTNLAKTTYERGLQPEHIEVAKAILESDTTDIDKFMDILTRKWKEHPELRFGQLVVNILGTDPFYIENANAINLINNYK